MPLYLAAAAAGGRARRHADHGRRRPHAARARRGAASCAASGSAPSAATRSPARSRATATTLTEVIQEMLLTTTSERQGRVIDHDSVGLDGEEEAGGVLLMAHAVERAARRPTSRPTSTPHEHKTLLRFITCGSVDDGKSHADRPAALRVEAGLRGPPRRARGRLEEGRHPGRRPRLRPAVDGLAAEREQGITIDVAYRFFSTERRKFIVADTPGPRAVHPQHGHRRVDRRPRRDPDRRPQGRAHPDPPPQLPRLAARHPPRRRSPSTSSTSSTTRRRSSTRSRPTTGPSPPRSASTDIVVHPDVGAAGRQHHRARATTRPGTTGPTLIELPRDGRDRRRRAAGAVPHAGAVGQPPGPRLPRLLRR